LVCRTYHKRSSFLSITVIFFTLPGQAGIEYWILQIEYL
jgi:hypothetical protein